MSVGAVIAPFAFLGPAYDEQLTELATNISDEKVYRAQGAPGQLVERLRHRHRAARPVPATLLQPGRPERRSPPSTPRDAGSTWERPISIRVGPVIWDLGAIAASGSPHALKLFRQVIFASASIPVVFEPAYIAVEAGGRRYDEMHVDGGVTAQLILYGDAISVADMKRHIPNADDPAAPKPTVYIIRNAKLGPEHHPVRPKLLNIGALAVTTLIKSQAVGDLYRLHAICRRDGLEFRLASIPDALGPAAHDTGVRPRWRSGRCTRAAIELGQAGYAWATEPPGLTAQPPTRAALR